MDKRRNGSRTPAKQAGSTQKTQKAKKSRLRLTVKLTFVALAALLVLSVVFVFVRMNLIPSANNLTPSEISSLTTISPSDTSLVRKLKSNALSAYLSSGSETLLVNLKTNETLIDSVENATIAQGDLQAKLDLIQTALNAAPADILAIRDSYYSSLIGKQTTALKSVFDKAQYTSLTSLYNSAIQLENTCSALETADMNYSQTSTNLFNALKLLTEINTNVTDVNSTLTAIANYDSLTSLFTLPGSLLAQQLSGKVGILNSYVDANIQVAAFKSKLQDLQTQNSQNQAILNSALTTPTVTGGTLEAAVNSCSSLGLNLQVTQVLSSSGIPVSVTNGFFLASDDKVTVQSPDSTQYKQITKGSALQITVVINEVESLNTGYLITDDSGNLSLTQTTGNSSNPPSSSSSSSSNPSSSSSSSQ